ncbi:flippase-like domain-containing protein [Thermosipho ferrireducens]|uniref:Flippase-like domain-containing protein n=1 Tax=Thermosipho ferrireducens TaxID=2571116 RepID=A0ABX7S8D5_9BACT|nr:lysylphosphatidylglycerol synthase transmembrane domain-containing protein [Thermosipho ferrireducens]QTA38846.1 flippase-like domain-containing protein [Thermosipho ferrireducens]
MRKETRVIVGSIIAVIISAIVIYIYSFSLNKNIILNIFSSVKLSQIFIAILLTLFAFGFDGVKHYIVLKTLGQEITLLDAINSCFILAFFSAVTPFSAGGQPFQMVYLNKKGVESTYSMNVVMLRFFEMIFLMFLIDATYIFLFSGSISGISGSLINLGLVLTLATSIVVILGMLFPKKIARILSLIRIPFLEKYIDRNSIEEWFYKLDYVVKTTFLEHKWLVFLDFIMMFVLLIIQSWVFYYAIKIFVPVHINFLQFLSIVNIVNTVVFLVPTPGASGSFEFIYSQALAPFAQNTEAIIKGVLFYRFLVYYLVLAVGIIILIVFAKKSATSKS